MTLLLVSNIVEYLSLALNIFLIIKTTINQRRRKKTDERYRKYVEDSNSVFVYKQVEQTQTIPSESKNSLIDDSQINKV